MLRTKGVEDPETRALLIEWTERQEAQADARNVSRANIEVNVERGKLYAEGGYFEEALEVLEDARMQAFQENEHDLYDAIMQQMDAVEDEMNKNKDRA